MRSISTLQLHRYAQRLLRARPWCRGANTMLLMPAECHPPGVQWPWFKWTWFHHTCCGQFGECIFCDLWVFHGFWWSCTVIKREMMKQSPFFPLLLKTNDRPRGVNWCFIKNVLHVTLQWKLNNNKLKYGCSFIVETFTHFCKVYSLHFLPWMCGTVVACFLKSFFHGLSFNSLCISNNLWITDWEKKRQG